MFNRALWRVPAGHYKVSVTLSASALTNVEVSGQDAVWLRSRIVVSATHGKTNLNLPVVMTRDTNRMGGSCSERQADSELGDTLSSGCGRPDRRSPSGSIARR